MKEKTIWKPMAILLAVILCFSFHFALPVSADYENTHINTGDQATDLVEVARTQVGYHEGTNNYTKYNVWFGSLNGYGYNYAWCQTFVAWCANQAGIPTSMIPRVSGTVSGMDFFKKNGTWKDAGITPEKGDIIYLYSKSSSGYHVGIVADVSGGQISTIEGNSSDQVAERSYSVGNSSIVGYGCPEYVTNPNPPTNLSIQSDKSYYSMGETIQFTFTSDYATELYIPIDVNGKRKFFMDVTGKTSYSCSFDEAGDYGFYLVARNAYGEASTVYMQFQIYDSAPSDLEIHTSKKEYALGENIDFSFTSKNAAELYIPIDVNGKRKFFMDVTGKTSYSCSFDEAGDYGFYLVARNAYGEASTVYMQFQIYDSAPSDLEIHTSKKEYALGENIDFSFTSKNAAELYIPVDVNGKRKFFMDVTGRTSYSCTFDEVGDYGFYLVARNAYGEATAKYMDFKIYDTVPQNLTIETDKKIFKLGESINFKFSCDYETELYIPVDVNGKRKFFIDVTGKDFYSCSFDEIGTYGFYLVARNAYGEATAKYMDFKIISPIQGDLNQDGTLSLTDLIPLQQSLLRQTTLTADEAQLADYNGDGNINVLDLMLLKRALLS